MHTSKDHSNAVVYDNQMGAGEDAEPTTAIGGSGCGPRAQRLPAAEARSKV